MEGGANGFYMTNKNGFTLLEVLIALVIISIAFAAVMSSINAGSRNFMHIRDKTSATWVASNVIAKAQLKLLNNAESGFENMMGSDWRWSLEKNTTPNANVNELIITVFSPQSGQKVSTVTGYLGGSDE